MVKDKEYELVPIKPIKDLQLEIRKLQSQLSKKDSQKDFTKILNSNLETQKSVKSILNTTNKLNDQLSNLLKIFKDVEAEEEHNPEILNRLTVIETQNKELTEKFEKVFAELRRLSYFKENLPQGLPVTYRRTK